jgi:hypothetical protein
MRHAVKAVLCLLAIVSAMWTIQPAAATTALERTEAGMIREAAVIVTGRCTNLRSQWAGRILVTVATISVSEVFKGRSGTEMTVILPGGVDLDRRIPIAMTVPAAPEILKQEDVLLFLNPEDLVAGSYSIVGFSQGKLTVVDGPGGEKVATQDLSALSLQGRDGSLRRGSAKTIPLASLHRKVREALAEGGRP